MPSFWYCLVLLLKIILVPPLNNNIQKIKSYNHEKVFSHPTINCSYCLQFIIKQLQKKS